MAILYDHMGHVGTLNECRLVDVEQNCLVSEALIGGEHLPHMKAFTFIIIKLSKRQTKQVSRQIQLTWFYFYYVYISAK